MSNVAFSPDIFEIQRHGGVSRYFVELAENLKSLGESNIEISAALHINYHLKSSNMNSGIYLPFSPSRLKLSKVISSINGSYSNALAKKKNFDIKHETYYRGGVEQIRASKTVTTIYDLVRETFTPNWHGFAAKQLSLNRSDAVICISRTTTSDLQNYYHVDPDKVFTIHLGVSNHFFSKTIPVKDRKGKQQLLYVGGRDGYKDFRTLVMAFSQSISLRENFQVLVFGSKFNGSELNLMRSLNVHDSFTHTSGGDEDLIAAYRDSIALVITSIYEGFGLTVLEAMSSGCAVVSTRGGSLAEITGGFDYYFEPSNPESLIEAIQRVTSNSKSNEELKVRAREHSHKFTWQKTAQNTLAVYRNLVASV
jgi:glycosyltransferase involved in cell wall biosynthesis